MTVALANRILANIYHLHKEQQSYQQLGLNHVEGEAVEVAKRRALGTVAQLDYENTFQSAEVA
jgi:hypothetical protein